MQAQRAHGVVRIAVKYGLLQGVLSFVIFLFGTLGAVRHNRVVAVANTTLLIVLMVLAHWEFKRNHAGRMTYAQGLGTGTLLSSAAAVISCVLMYVYVRYINSGYLAAVMQAQRAALERRGITGAQAQLAIGITAAITTPVGIAVTSLITGVLEGFIVALIVSIFTQKADPEVVV